MKIQELLSLQREFYNTNKLKSSEFKRRSLLRIKKGLLNNKKNICQALYRDLGKSPFESISSEIDPIIGETDILINRLERNSPVCRGLGNVLLFMPHTLPLLTAFREIISCIYAGNCIMLMTNPRVRHTSEAIQNIIKEALFKRYVFAFNSDFDGKRLLSLEFDYICHIDSDTKPNPVYLDNEADLNRAVENIVFSKSIDCGQRYNSPDTIYVNKKILESFIPLLRDSIETQIGSDPLIGDDYCRIVDSDEYDRLINMIDMDNVIYGGAKSKKALKIGPHIILRPQSSQLINNAIHGPLYPVIPVSTQEGLKCIDKLQPNNVYVFSKNKNTVKLFKNAFPGKVSINSAFRDFDFEERMYRYSRR